MIKLERIVCPTDLSEDSERTIRYAVALTRASGAKLFVWYRAKTSPIRMGLATIQKPSRQGLTFTAVLIMHADELEWLDSSTGEISLRNVLGAYDFSLFSQLALQ